MSPNYARFTVLLITASQVGLTYNSYNINRQSASISSAFPALIFLTQNTTLREIRISLDTQQRWLRLSDSPILDVHRVL